MAKRIDRFNSGRAHWNGPRGWFIPEGPIHRYGPDKNPLSFESKVTWAARMFVGLNIGDDEALDINDVVEAFEKNYRGGASFVAQMGRWPSKGGKIITEKSVQVIVINDKEGVTAQEFRGDMIDVAERMALELQQESIVLELQRNGVVKETLGVVP